MFKIWSSRLLALLAAETAVGAKTRSAVGMAGKERAVIMRTWEMKMKDKSWVRAGSAGWKGMWNSIGNLGNLERIAIIAS